MLFPRENGIASRENFQQGRRRQNQSKRKPAETDERDAELDEGHLGPRRAGPFSCAARRHPMRVTTMREVAARIEA
jgi:hypothetical protein